MRDRHVGKGTEESSVEPRKISPVTARTRGSDRKGGEEGGDLGLIYGFKTDDLQNFRRPNFVSLKSTHRRKKDPNLEIGLDFCPVVLERGEAREGRRNDRPSPQRRPTGVVGKLKVESSGAKIRPNPSENARRRVVSGARLS